MPSEKTPPKSTPKSREADRKAEMEARSAAAPTDAAHHPDAVVEGPPVVTQDDPMLVPAGGVLTSAPDPSMVAPESDPAAEVAGEGKWELFNPTSGPIVYDDAGHIVGGGDRVRVDTIPNDSPAARHIAAKRLHKRRVRDDEE